MLVILSIILTSHAWLSQTTANQLCTDEKLQECYDLLNKDGLPSAVVLYFSEEVMTEHCRRYKIFSECMKTIRPYCSNSRNLTVLVYQGLDSAYGFLCGSGFKEYIEYQAVCFKEDDIQIEANTCSSIFTSRSDYLKNNITDKKYMRARYCQYVDDYVDCVYNLLRSFCGEKAANWHRTFDIKSVQPTMVAFGCLGWPVTEATPPDSTAAIWVIALGGAIVVTGVIVAIGLSILICSRCECRRRCSRRRSVSVDMPPPYSGPPFTTISRSENETTPATSTSINPSCRTGKTCDIATPITSSRPRGTPNPSGLEIQIVKEDGTSSVGSCISRTISSSGTVFDDPDEAAGAVGGSSPFVRSYTPTGHFEMPSSGSSILSFLQSSDDDTASLISHTCDYY